MAKNLSTEMAQPAYCEAMHEMAGWSVHTVTPGHASPPIWSGEYATVPSPPMQISPRARPASYPPSMSTPASMIRAPVGRTWDRTRSSAACSSR
jgi:hypothetical protein